MLGYVGNPVVHWWYSCFGYSVPVYTVSNQKGIPASTLLVASAISTVEGIGVRPNVSRALSHHVCIHIIAQGHMLHLLSLLVIKVVGY